MVLKTDFKRRNNALLCGIGLFTVSHVPVDDFWLSILLMFYFQEIAQNNINTEKSPKYSIQVQSEKIPLKMC